MNIFLKICALLLLLPALGHALTYHQKKVANKRAICEHKKASWCANHRPSCENRGVTPRNHCQNKYPL